MTGNQLPMQPNHKFAAILVNEREMGNGDRLHFQGAYTYTGSQHPNIGNIADYEIPSYSRWDANVMWTTANESWSVLGYVQNVFNQIGLVEYLPMSGLGSNPALGYPTHPRELGVQVRYRMSN